MTILKIAVLVLFVLALAVGPAILLIYGATLLSRTRSARGAALIAGGAVMLSITSLDFLVTAVIGYTLDAEALASYVMISGYVSMGLELVGMLLVGFGVVLFARQMRVADSVPPVQG